MMHEAHHDHLIKELSEQLEPVFKNSPQGIYLYLDDHHKNCNQKLADLLGYKSIAEWIANEFPVEDVAEEDRDKVIDAYMHASEKFIGQTVSAALMTKDGKKIKTDVTMVPITYKDETFVLHFISEK